MENLRRLVRALLEKDIKEEELLTEPDETEGREEQEVSSGGVAGVATPLGTGPNYPGPSRRKRGTRTPHEVAAAAFGGSSKKSKK